MRALGGEWRRSKSGALGKRFLLSAPPRKARHTHMGPIRRSVLAPSACASVVSGALTSEKPFGSLLIANPVSRVLLRECT